MNKFKANSLIEFDNNSMPYDTKLKLYNLTRSIGNYLLPISDKRFGIEPGFEAVTVDDNFHDKINQLIQKESLKKDLENALSNFKKKELKMGTLLKQHHDDLEKLLNNFDEIINNLKKSLENSKVEDIINLLKEDKSAGKIISILIRELNKNLKEPFTVWMYKQNYDEPSNYDYVGVTQERCKLLGRNDGATSKTRQKANMGAILECVANDIALAFGAPAQNQKLILSEYSNKQIKFMTACEIENNYQDLSGNTYVLTGDYYKPEQKKGLFENFLIDKEDEGKIGAKTQSPPLLGTLLALMISMQERDFIGAYGQNKGLVNGLPFIVDLGKAYEKDHGIIETLQNNGQFDQPYAWLPIDAIRRHTLFRNVSVCYDVPFHETMLGFHLLNKLLTGKNPSNEIIQSYQNKYININIKKFFEQKNPTLAEIFDSHIENLKSIITTREEELEDEQIKELEGYIKTLQKAKTRAVENAKKIVKKFESRFSLSADQVDLLSNIENLTSPDVYNLTKDGKTQIQHLQCNSSSRIPWELTKIDDNKYILSTKLNENPNLKYLKPIFKSQIANQAMKNLMEFSNLSSNYEPKFAEDGKVNLLLTKAGLEELIEKITPEKVHHARIPLSSSVDDIVNQTTGIIKEYRTNKLKTLSFFNYFRESVGDYRSQFYQHLLANENKIIQLIAGALPVFSSFLYDESAYTGQKLHQKFHYIESIAISTLHSH